MTLHRLEGSAQVFSPRVQNQEAGSRLRLRLASQLRPRMGVISWRVRPGAVGRLRELRLENGLSLDDFTIPTPLTDAFTTADYQRAVGIRSRSGLPRLVQSGGYEIGID